MQYGFKTLCALVLGWCATVYAGQPLTVVYGDAYKPFAWERDGEIVGVQPDFVNAILVEEMGLSVIHEPCPWKRCQRQVELGQRDAFFTVPTEERATYTVRTQQPFYTTHFVLHTAKDNPFVERLKSVSSLEELSGMKALRHVYMLGSGWHETHLAGVARVKTAQNSSSIPLILARNWADVYVEQRELFRFQAQAAGLEDELVSLDQNALRTLGWHLFIGEKSEHAELIPRIDAVLRELADSGELERIKARIFARYGMTIGEMPAR